MVFKTLLIDFVHCMEFYVRDLFFRIAISISENLSTTSYFSYLFSTMGFLNACYTNLNGFTI